MGPNNLSGRQLIAAAVPRSEFDNRKSWLSRAARAAGVSYRQARALFYGEINDEDHRTVTRFKRAAERQAKSDAARLADEFASIANGLAHSDPDFYGADIDSLRAACDALRALGRARDQGD
jgi:hypothetical protein